MKRFICIVLVLILLYLVGDYVRFHTDWYVRLHPDQVVSTFTRADSDTIYLDTGSGYAPFEIKGVDMGSGIPGEWSTDFAITEETYLRWFRQIQDMGANTIRIYTVQSSPFYEAFYRYNENNPEPLYLIHGVWVNDYVQNSRVDAYDSSFYDTFEQNCHTMVNVIHGSCKLNMGEMASAGYGNYRRDISPWVIGYILGVEWMDTTVVFTDERYQDNPYYCGYQGDYMYTAENATPFETMLCRVGDSTIRYETERYGTQRLVAFSNWPTTDPFDYPEIVSNFFVKCAKVNVEHIRTTEKFLSGQFASYHVYPYYPDYLIHAQNLDVINKYDVKYFLQGENWSFLDVDDLSPFTDEDGVFNTYLAYLTALTDFHSMPVVISEFGVSTGRGIAQLDQNTGRNQGHMSEAEQGQAIRECYADIMTSGCAGSCIFTWQDEWFKRTWNTMYAIDMKRNPYWSDYQTNEQYFGLLSFDPGKETCVSHVDGDVSEWTEADIVSRNEGMTLSVKYDERYVYLMVHKPGLNFGSETIYIPIDTTQKSGSTWFRDENLSFSRPADFLLILDGKENSRMLVQEYYEALRANYAQEVYGFDTYVKDYIPMVDSPDFVDINLILRVYTMEHLLNLDKNLLAETFPTGKLRYGNGNPESPDFDSLADFICSGENIEVRIPWQMLNFADPSRMEIHDDYYTGDNYGVDYTNIDFMYFGVASAGTQNRVVLDSLKLKPWDNNVTYHERLKASYYVVQQLWRDGQ